MQIMIAVLGKSFPPQSLYGSEYALNNSLLYFWVNGQDSCLPITQKLHNENKAEHQ